MMNDNGGTTTSYSCQMAELALKTRFVDLPAAVLEKIKLCILDSIGVMTAAAGQESSRVLHEYVIRTFPGNQGPTVFGFGSRPSLQGTVLLNAAMLHSLELEDHHSHQRSLNHPGVTSTPTALALGELHHLSGADVLLGVAMGYEMGSRIGLAGDEVGWLNLQRGFHESSVCGPFSAATVAGVLTGASTRELANAYGICGSLAAGSMEFKTNGAWSKRLQVGSAAGNGVMALELAMAGYTGPMTVFEGKHGFYNSYMLPGKYDVERLLRGYGDEWEVPNIQFKPFGCAGTLHSAVTASVEMRQKHRLRAEEIAGVTIHTSSTLIAEYGEPRAEKAHPTTEVDAQFSLPYAVAVALCTGRALLREFEEPVIHDPVINAVSDVVGYAVDKEIDAGWPKNDATRLEVVLHDGSRLEVEVPYAKGDLEWPVTADEVVDKFHALTEEHLSPDTRNELINMCLNMENVADVGVIPAMCQVAGAASLP